MIYINHMKTLDYYWQKYPAKVQSILCIAGDVLSIASGAVSGNVFRALAPAMGTASHLVNLVFGKGGKTKDEKFVLDATLPNPLNRALSPWRYPVDTQGAMLVVAGGLFVGSGLNFFDVQGFVNYPEALAGVSCIIAASTQWIMKEKEGHLQELKLGSICKITTTQSRKCRLHVDLSDLFDRLGPTRIASSIFLVGNLSYISGAVDAMIQHHSITQYKDVLMFFSGLLWFSGSYQLGRVKKARVELQH